MKRQIQKNKVGVLGLGAIGSVISYALSQNSDIQLLGFNRSLKNELKLIVNGDKKLIPIQVKSEVEQNITLDWLIICLKEFHYAEASSWFENLIHSTTKIAVIRNGINLKDPLTKYTKPDNILACIIDCSVSYQNEGFYEPLQPAVITTQDNALADEFRTLFRNSDVRIKQMREFKTESWKKVCESSALGAILCLSGETCWIFKDSEIRKLYTSLLEECILVARADGAAIDEDFTDEMLSKIDNYPGTKGSSMLTDRLKGNQIELGAKNGIISRIGKQHNVSTPLNDLIVLLLKHTNNKSGD